MIPRLVATGPRAPGLTRKHVAVALAFALWLEAGYAAVLVSTADLKWPTAVWQAALCFTAAVPLLLAVIQFVSLPKLIHHFAPKWSIKVLWRVDDIAEPVLPWLGWATLLWVLNGGPWLRALFPAAGVALFSYLTGGAVLLLFGPRPRHVQVTRLEVHLPVLPPTFDGYTILHISDLHAGRMLPPQRARLAPALELSADLVAFTGDLASDRPYVHDAAAVLSELRSRDGAFAVLGNHDNWLGRGLIEGELAKHGVRTLVNEHVALDRGGTRLYVAGVDNAAYASRDNLPAALRGIPDDAAIIVLSHAPEIITRPGCQRAGLVLSGHTHGGQVVLPLIGPVHVTSELGRRYAAGLFQYGAGWLYINRGLGEIFPPLRLLCPPEIALITLRPPTARK